MKASNNNNPLLFLSAFILVLIVNQLERAQAFLHEDYAAPIKKETELLLDQSMTDRTDDSTEINEDEDLFENENISATLYHDDSYVMVDQDEESDYRHFPLASPDRKNNVGCYYSPSSSTELCNGTIQHLSLIRKEMLLSLNKTVNQLMTAIRLQTIELVKYHLVNIKETWARVEHINKVLIDHVMAVNTARLEHEVELNQNLKRVVDKTINDAEMFLLVHRDDNRHQPNSSFENKDSSKTKPEWPMIPGNNRPTPQQPMNDHSRLRELRESRKASVELLKGYKLNVEYLAAANNIEGAFHTVSVYINDPKYGIWPKIVSKSIAIYEIIVRDVRNPHRRSDIEKEEKYQNELLDIYAAILFTAKMRRCKSRFETYFPPKGRCIKFTSEKEILGACPDNQIIVDGSGNRGNCDCKKDEPTILNPIDNQCYVEFSQGPCLHFNQWWVMADSGKPECRLIPDSCPPDGKHVFWSPHKNGLKRCYRIGDRGPCPINQVIARKGLKIYCSSFSFNNGRDLDDELENFESPMMNSDLFDHLE